MDFPSLIAYLNKDPLLADDPDESSLALLEPLNPKRLCERCVGASPLGRHLGQQGLPWSSRLHY